VDNSVDLKSSVDSATNGDIIILAKGSYDIATTPAFFPTGPSAIEIEIRGA
jgi:hypothetical protein